MTYESSYDVGLKPFNHDKKRGKWASPVDFLFTCVGHAFKMDTIFSVPSIVFRDTGIYGLLLYLVALTFCTVPIIFIQSFLGQFSSTGFISVFRISPIFKGIGYAVLALNVATLAFYSIYAAIPMFFFIHSMRPTLPWSCEGLHWLKNIENRTTPCNVGKVDLGLQSFLLMQVPSATFFENHLNIERWNVPEFTHSWLLMLCTIIVWLAVWAILEKPTEMIGRILRYTGVVIFGVLVLCFLRFFFLPGAFAKLLDFTETKKVENLRFHIFVPTVALAGLGPGWGTILSMASYNNFKTDTAKYSWILCLGQLGLVILASFSFIFIEGFLYELSPGNSFLERDYTQLLKLMSIPTGLSKLEMPNFWSLIFFGMVTLGVLTLLVVQLFSVLTSLFDEFEQLRNMKTRVLRIFIAVLGLTSLLFCSNPCNVGSVEIESESFLLMQVPSITFFENHINKDLWNVPEFTHSWLLTLCTIIVWLVVWAVLEKPTAMIGRILRYSGIVIFGILVLCFARFLFLPGAFENLLDFIEIKKLTEIRFQIVVPIVALAGLGPGWGTILSMASYNNFKTDTAKYTWILCLGQFGLVTLASFSHIFVGGFLRASNPVNPFQERGFSQLFELMSIPTGLSMLELPNFWSLIFFGMVTFGVLNLLVVQLFSVLTSLFDEFEQLRNMKTRVLRIFIAILGLTSLLFCSNKGYEAFTTLTIYSLLPQIVLNLLLLLVVLWIYGRERFQHDLYFMTNRKLPTWMVYFARFITPFFLLFSFPLVVFIVARIDDRLSFTVVTSFIIFLPWLLVPGFCVYKLIQTGGLRCVRPAFWYPAENIDRQAYQANSRRMQVVHQLTTAEYNHCNVSSIGSEDIAFVHLPTLDFFEDHMNLDGWDYKYKPDYTHSWTLTLCTIVIWLTVWAVLEKPTETIGRILRYATIVIFAILGICFLRFLFLPGAISRLFLFITPKVSKRLHAYFLIPSVALAGLGPGWGTILSMASYNQFKTDITKNTWILCLGQLALVILASFSCVFIENFLVDSRPDALFIGRTETQWLQMISLPTGLSLLEMPNLWSLLFFGMLTLGVLSLLVVQLFSVLTSLFDEFEKLRTMKKKVIRISVAVFGVTSILFCSNTGYEIFQTLTGLSVLSQIFLNLLLLLVILWIYGRERFQFDLFFMTNRRYPTWMVYVVRFIAPLFLLFSGLLGLLILAMVIMDPKVPFTIGSAIIIFLPWLLVPGFCIYKLMQTSGSFSARFKRCAKPTDWYPADPVERQAYDEACSSSQISYQLTTTEDEV